MCKAHKGPDHLHCKLKSFRLGLQFTFSYNLLEHDPALNESNFGLERLNIAKRK